MHIYVYTRIRNFYTHTHVNSGQIFFFFRKIVADISSIFRSPHPPPLHPSSPLPGPLLSVSKPFVSLFVHSNDLSVYPGVCINVHKSFGISKVLCRSNIRCGVLRILKTAQAMLKIAPRFPMLGNTVNVALHMCTSRVSDCSHTNTVRKKFRDLCTFGDFLFKNICICL